MNRKRTALMLAALCVALFAGCGGQAKQEEPARDLSYVVAWEDPAMEHAAHMYLNKDAGQAILAEELSTIQLVAIKSNSFIQFNNAEAYSIKDFDVPAAIEDLKHFSHLGSVTLSRTDVADLSVLANFNHQMQQVLLYNNPNITDVGALSDMTRMVVFVSHNNSGLHDFEPILGLDSLVELDLRRAKISAMNFEGRLPKLKILKIDANDIRDLDTLAELPCLTELDVHGNNIADLTPLSGLTGLLKLRLDSNHISDLTPLAPLQSLTLLDVSYNRLESLAGIEGLTKLVRLDISGNKIEDLSALRGMAKLKYLHAGKNNISSVEPLTGLSDLYLLELPRNQISNLVQFESMKALRNLDISDNPVVQTDIENFMKKRPSCKVTTNQAQ